MRFHLLKAFVVAGLAWLMSVPVYAGCIRHFTNRSSYPWSISGYDGSKKALLIAPGATVEIPYGEAATLIVISGQIPNRTFTKQFQLQATSDSCYEILHQGNPGYISLNKPLTGDVVTCTGGC